MKNPFALVFFLVWAASVWWWWARQVDATSWAFAWQQFAISMGGAIAWLITRVLWISK